MSVGYGEFAKAFGLNREYGSDRHVWGNVKAVNADGSYQVRLNASTMDTRCANGCAAAVGDRVLVCIMEDGRAVAVSRCGGDRFPDAKVLAAPYMFMDGSQSITLSEPVSAQRIGIVLVWCFYSGGVQTYDWVYTFVPKWHVTGNPGTSGVTCDAINADAIMAKYVYVKDNTISGYRLNGSTVTVGGVTASNGNWVLHTVLGV